MRFVYHTRGSASVVVILLTSLSLVGQTRPPAASDEANEVPNTGAITGRVINENGQPLPNATVFIRAFGSTEQGRSLITDQEGNFQSSGLDRVAYLVSASVPGYAVPPRDLDSPQVPVYRVGDSVTLVMAKGGVITGSVTTSAGEPVVGVRVQAQMIRDGNGQPSRYGATIKDRATDDRGVYRIYGLLSGTYVVMAGAGGNPWGPGVSAYDTDAPTYAPSSSRATAAEITVRTGEESSNVDIRYRGEPGHVISGTANGSQTAEPSVFLITLSSTQDGGSQWSTSSYQPIGSRGFVFFGVADGEYDVTAQSFFPTGERMLSKPKRITVKGADVSGIELITQPLGLISGRVVLEDSKAVECKDKRRPVFTETQVSAWHNEKDKAQDQPQFIWSLGAPSIPDAQGNITLRNLAPGQYRFVARFFAKYWYLESIALPAGATPVARSTPVMRNADIAGNWITLKQGERVTG
ncbi:MAG TPA: carboxypeptidase-like regulatory domain-containing protein, partial [Pyrinomonadaceae bacterium]|nr:carboxypeptidase-like regulatory domain-containing protein [Pyrinomonadaceae bacterium]